MARSFHRARRATRKTPGSPGASRLPAVSGVDPPSRLRGGNSSSDALAAPVSAAEETRMKTRCFHGIPVLSHQRHQPGQYLRHHRPGLHHGLRHRQDAELRPRRHHHGGRLCLLLRHELPGPAGPAVGVLLAMLACTVLGIIIERLAYKPLRAAPRLAVLITAIGVSYFLQNSALLHLEGRPQVLPGGGLRLGAISSAGQLKVPYITLADHRQSALSSCWGSDALHQQDQDGQGHAGRAPRTRARRSSWASTSTATISMTFAIGFGPGGHRRCAAVLLLLPR